MLRSAQLYGVIMCLYVNLHYYLSINEMCNNRCNLTIKTYRIKEMRKMAEKPGYLKLLCGN